MSKLSSSQTLCSQTPGSWSASMDEDSTSPFPIGIFMPILSPALTASRLSEKYEFQRPNDRSALELMNAAAVEVMKDLPDLCIAYGVSDEYRFVTTSSHIISANERQFRLPSNMRIIRAAQLVSLR